MIIDVYHAVKTATTPREYFELKYESLVNFLNKEHPLFIDTSDTDAIKLKALCNILGQYNGGIVYGSSQELVSACHTFMLSNIRAISSGETRELIDTGSFTVSACGALLRLLVVDGVEYDGSIRYRVATESVSEMLTSLVLLMYDFVSYVQVALAGLVGLPHSGYYKIAVCRFQLRKEPECGKVFFARSINQDACEEHRLQWQSVKGGRKYRNKK